jgi:TolB protein
VYSPDGKRIVFVRAYQHFHHGYKQSDLWTMRADGTHKARLTSTPGVFEFQPAWSPDGKQVVFAVDRQGIWVMGLEGLGRRQLAAGDDSSPSWSPDGSTIAFARDSSIRVVPVAGGTPTNLSTDPGVFDYEPIWSPDGTKILFSSEDPDTLALDLWVMNTDGSNRVRITNTPNRDEIDRPGHPTAAGSSTAAQATPRAGRSI